MYIVQKIKVTLRYPTNGGLEVSFDPTWSVVKCFTTPLGRVFTTCFFIVSEVLPLAPNLAGFLILTQGIFLRRSDSLRNAIFSHRIYQRSPYPEILEPYSTAVDGVNEDNADVPDTMDDFASETDSDYTSYWRDWVSDCEMCQDERQLPCS